MKWPNAVTVDRAPILRHVTASSGVRLPHEKKQTNQIKNTINKQSSSQTSRRRWSIWQSSLGADWYSSLLLARIGGEEEEEKDDKFFHGVVGRSPPRDRRLQRWAHPGAGPRSPASAAPGHFLIHTSVTGASGRVNEVFPFHVSWRVADSWAEGARGSAAPVTQQWQKELTLESHAILSIGRNWQSPPTNISVEQV